MKRVPQKVDIPGFEGLYYVTIEGEVYRYGKDKPLKPFERASGKKEVILSKNSKATHKSIGVIMKECYFKDIPQDYLLARKGSKSDFSYWNLFPISRKDFNAKINPRRKCVVRIKDGKVEFYSSARKCSKDNFYNAAEVAKICNSKSKKGLDGATYMWEKDYDYDK